MNVLSGDMEGLKMAMGLHKNFGVFFPISSTVSLCYVRRARTTSLKLGKMCN